MAKSAAGFQAPQEECSWLSRRSGFISHQTALGSGPRRPAGLTGWGLQPCAAGCVGLRARPDRLLGSHFQCHPPLFTDPLVSKATQTLGFKRAQEKRALVILPAHPRKPGQAWQHQSFRVGLSALSKGTAVATELQVPGEQTCLPSQSQHCPGLRADYSDTEARKGQNGQ